MEAAILDAAWNVLEASGYEGFTFEGVARRAETSKPVLYRRWPGRVDLAFAAIAHHLRLNPVTVPDMSCVRQELCSLLRRFTDRTPPRLTRLVFEMSEDMRQREARFADLGEDPMQEVLARGVARGEIDPSKLIPRIATLPVALVFHEIIITQRPVSEEAIREIVDDIFLPLVEPKPKAS